MEFTLYAQSGSTETESAVARSGFSAVSLRSLRDSDSTPRDRVGLLRIHSPLNTLASALSLALRPSRLGPPPRTSVDVGHVAAHEPHQGPSSLGLSSTDDSRRPSPVYGIVYGLIMSVCL